MPRTGNSLSKDLRDRLGYSDSNSGHISGSSRYGGRYSNAVTDSSSGNSAPVGSSAWLDIMWQQYGLPESMRNEFYNNPHLSEYLEYRGSSGIFGGLSEIATGSSSHSRNRAKALAAIYDYWNNLKSENRQNEYNSEESKAERMREAGLNPSLLGTGDVSEDVGNPEAQFDIPFESGSSDIAAGLNPILEIAKTYLSLRTGFANLQSIGLQNDNLASTNLSSIADFARGAALDSIQPSDFDDYKADNKAFLNGVLKQSEELAKNYFGEDYPHFLTARKVFRNAFNQHRSSVFANYKSWDEYSKMRGSQRDTMAFDYDMQNGITKSSLNLQLLRTQIESRYANLESELLNNADYTQLWKDERFASIRASIEKAHESEMQSGFNADVWEQISQSDGAVNDASQAILEDFKAAISEAVAAAKEADLRAADVAVIQNFNDYLYNNGAYKTNNMYDAGSKMRTLYRGASARYGAYAEYLPVTLDDLINTTLQIKNFESRGRSKK